MSASQSDLSDPKFGYDLVVAVTQASLNATLKRYLDNVTEPEVVACYVYDSNDNLVEIDYTQLKQLAKGSDPFAVPPGADPATNPDLINLASANFAGGVKAMIGLPAVPIANLPPIVTLGSGTDAPVLYNLLCAEFQIAGFEYGPRGEASWINAAQPTGPNAEPWYFSAHVELNPTTIDPHSPVPVDVQERIQQLLDTVGPNAFSVQSLLLDLDTAILESTPTIEGIPPGWAVWTLISQVFLGAYLTGLRANGAPMLGFTFSMTNPPPATMALGALSHECCALLDNGQPIPEPTPAQEGAATFVYLGTPSTTPPTPQPFPWNWVELGDVSAMSGVQAVRRGVFASYLIGVLSQADLAMVCQDTTVNLTHSGDDYTIQYYSNRSPNPASFVATPPGDAALLTIGYQHSCHDDSEAADHLTSIHGDYNYTLDGSVTATGNTLVVSMRSQVYMGFNHHEVGINYNDLPGANYYDKTFTTTYQLTVGQDGKLQVNCAKAVTDQSAPWDCDPGGIMGKFGLEKELLGYLQDVTGELDSFLDQAFDEYADGIADVINGYQGWVFPAASSFVFKDVAFSNAQDLISELTYADPTLQADVTALATR